MKTLPGERGAYLVELSIGLPALLVIVMGCLWLSHILVARSGLSYGMQTALRLAAARGDATAIEGDMTVGVIQAVHDWQDNPGGPPNSELLQLLNSAYPTDIGYAQSYLNHYVVPEYYSTSSSHSRIPLKNLPASYTYALIYIHQAMRQSVGSFIKFPCPVQCSRPATPSRPCGDGCMTCEFSVPPSVPNITSSPPGRNLELTCHYAVPSPLQKILSISLAMLSGTANPIPDVVITRRASVNLS